MHLEERANTKGVDLPEFAAVRLDGASVAKIFNPIVLHLQHGLTDAVAENRGRTCVSSWVDLKSE